MESIALLLLLFTTCISKPSEPPLTLPNPNYLENIENWKDINAKPLRSAILDQILGDSYDSKTRPMGVNGSGPVEVGVSIHIQNIEYLDDVQMEYNVQIICRQEWIDLRLKFSHIESEVNYLQMLETSRVWVPDLVFSNEKSGDVHDLMFSNMYVRIFPQGEVLMSARLTMKLFCRMNLLFYPMDFQYCNIIMVSYAWTTEDLLLKWVDDNSVVFAKGIFMPRFRLISYGNTTCENSVTRTGVYDCIELKLEFKRDFGYYLIQMYVPCVMLVIVSWVSFWLEPTATEARISLCVTTILTVVTQTYGINASVPPASYVKAIDVWLFTVQFMVFASILQFSYVNYLARFHWKAQLIASNISNEDLRHNRAHYLKEEGEKRAKHVDKISKIMFPTVFLIFNILYWTIYLNPEKEDTSLHQVYGG